MHADHLRRGCSARLGAVQPGIRTGVLLLVSVLTGCATSYISPQDATSLILDRSSAIQVGQMERAAVRGVLGTPQIASAYWGFDLFRADTSQTEVVFAVTPWPVPFARLKDRLQRYTLVAYDASDRAGAVASGIFRKPASWRNIDPIQADFPSLHLRAGELLFFIDPEGARNVNLLVSPRRRDAFLQDLRATKDCTVIVGCGDRGCADQVSVDAGPVRRLPLRTAHTYWLPDDVRDAWLGGVAPCGTDPGMPWLEALVALKLGAGEHVLEFSAKHLGGKASLEVDCLPGEVTYVVVDATSNASFWQPQLVAWQITRTEAMPERFRQRPLVLLDDGQWYVDANPGE